MPDQTLYCQRVGCGRPITVAEGVKPTSLRCPRCNKDTTWDRVPPPSIFNREVSENDRRFLRSIRITWTDDDSSNRV